MILTLLQLAHSYRFLFGVEYMRGVFNIGLSVEIG